jgi:hypothetical protein
MNLYPGKKFAFTGAIADVADSARQIPFNEFVRYPSDRSGKRWLGSPYFDLALWLQEASKFIEDFRRLEPLIKARKVTGRQAPAPETGKE